jgi:hypothetical protein
MTGKPRGGNGNGGNRGNRGDGGDGGNGQRPRDGSGGGVPSSISKGQDQLAEVLGRGRSGGQGGTPGTGGGRGGRGTYRAGDDVPGPARGRDLRTPHPRHTINGSRNGVVKDPSTVYLRGYEDVMHDDVAQIAAGNARWDPTTQRYEINGRYYGVEPSGTVFPDSGVGMVKLSGTEYAALKEIVRAGGDISQAPQLTRNPRFVNNPQAVEKAMQIYNGTYEP